MSSTGGNPSTSADVKELASKVQQFLSQQVESNADLSDAAKESLVVATECIEQAYGIQRKAASNDLLNMYTASKQPQPQQQQQQHNQQQQTNNANNSTTNQQPLPQMAYPTQLISHLASTLFSPVGTGFVNTLASAAANAASGQQPEQQQQPAEQTSASATTSGAPKNAPEARKKPTEAEAIAAESFKNQGNDCMKQDKFKEAYDYYTSAIEIDNSNAIYYSNRAAASLKLGNHQAAVNDCQQSIDIDPNYSKAYGRMGLAYASLENHQKAKEAYVKAVELDPTNESYRNNLATAEGKLAGGQTAGGAPGNQANLVDALRSMINNPEVVSLAMRSLQDPRVQGMFGFGNPGGPGAGAGQPPR